MFVGARIAKLTAELAQIGAYQSMRKLQQAADLFQEDVVSIMKREERAKKNGRKNNGSV